MALELYQSAISKYIFESPEDPCSMMAQKEHHQIRLLVIHVVTALQAGIPCGGDVDLVWEILIDLLGRLGDG